MPLAVDRDRTAVWRLRRIKTGNGRPAPPPNPSSFLFSPISQLLSERLPPVADQRRIAAPPQGPSPARAFASRVSMLSSSGLASVPYASAHGAAVRRRALRLGFFPRCGGGARASRRLGVDFPRGGGWR
jgi:hypothetical protein